MGKQNVLRRGGIRTHPPRALSLPTHEVTPEMGPSLSAAAMTASTALASVASAGTATAPGRLAAMDDSLLSLRPEMTMPAPACTAWSCLATASPMPPVAPKTTNTGGGGDGDAPSSPEAEEDDAETAARAEAEKPRTPATRAAAGRSRRWSSRPFLALTHPGRADVAQDKPRRHGAHPANIVEEVVVAAAAAVGPLPRVRAAARLSILIRRWEGREGGGVSFSAPSGAACE